ncbi:MAG: ThiF family adenylyltransferase [Bacteroidota bacterium]|nr:ThiF family adenylyltransferase [Bacteroidota bacterium]
MSDGQRTALSQVRRISAVDGSPVRIVKVLKSLSRNGELIVHITVDCRMYECKPGGLKLNDQEGIELHIPVEFPFVPPQVFTPHTRFRDAAHVQWGQQICLYASVETQWNPSQGMAGFIGQLGEWLKRGARNELDFPDQPVEPPRGFLPSALSVHLDSAPPDRSHWPWCGAGLFTESKRNLIKIARWETASKVPSNIQFAPTVLLDFVLTGGYPHTVMDLLQHLERNSDLCTHMLALLMLASEHASTGTYVLVGIGTPLRGLVGDWDGRRQHFMFWTIRPLDVLKLAAISTLCNLSRFYRGRNSLRRVKKCISPAESSIKAWCNEAKLHWCNVLEDRPEIVTRRDKSTPMDWFRDKRVALWGCGAVGGMIAEHLVRAGVSKIVLHDRSHVTPGILVRQNYTLDDLTVPKAVALKRRLKAIAPDVSVKAMTRDMLTRTLIRKDWNANVDVIIDATASLQIRCKLETLLKDQELRVPIAAVMLSAKAHIAAIVVVRSGYQAGPYDVYRRLGLAARNRDWLKEWADAFWSRDAVSDLRQPEPGCSDPTFVASHADVSSLSARAINAIAKALAADDECASGFLFEQSPEQRDHEFRFRRDICWMADGIDIRLSAAAWRDMYGWIQAGTRERSPDHETGGLLFGAFDEALGIAWITNVSGPPQDSIFKANSFVCGTEGTAEISQQYADLTNGVVQYIGMWHTHPHDSAKPSLTDRKGIRAAFDASTGAYTHQLMLIVGYSSGQSPEIGGYLFSSDECDTLEISNHGNTRPRGGITTPEPFQPPELSMGLALSGGGSRAIAFHLGTLRALEDLGLLDHVMIVSGVSGGSVMTGLIGYSNAPFGDIDRATVSLLRRGLQGPAFRKMWHPKRACRLAWYFVAVALPMLVIDGIVFWIGKLGSACTGLEAAGTLLARSKEYLHRRYSCVHVLADTIADELGTLNCDAPTRQNKSIVFNACELRTGTAFRMSNERFGSWRHGFAAAKESRIADAIAASAAYPLILPPFDWTREYNKQGEPISERVIVTDGGVIDNLGVSVMEPDRDPQFSGITYCPEVIISSDAGIGQFPGQDLPIGWPARLMKVSSAVMRKVGDATKKRLHDHLRVGRIKGFIYANLGQIDGEVLFKTAHWVHRENVIDYPTDFRAMKDDDIRRLSARGETITRALVTRYLLSD